MDFRDEWTNNPYYADNFLKNLNTIGKENRRLKLLMNVTFNSKFKIYVEIIYKRYSKIKNILLIFLMDMMKKIFRLNKPRDGGEKFVITTGSLMGNGI